MGQPIWQIRNSNLGTIAENIFFEYELEAIDTEFDPVSYSLIAGSLPEGIQLTGTSISGIPIKITGVPAEVDDDTSTQFAIRATTTTNEVSDITLDLTVSGQTVPEITTTAGSLGTFAYGDYIDIQLDAEDTDLGQGLTWSVINNTLPEGLELIVDPDDDRIAYIRGYPTPVSALPPGIDPGFDASDWDADLSGFGFDFGLNALDKTFEFIISITDGIGFDSSTFSIFLTSTLVFYKADAKYPEVASDDLEIGEQYRIRVAGTGDWTTAGAADSNVGTVFTAGTTTNGASDGLARDTTTESIWVPQSADSGLMTADHTVSDGKINPIITTPAQDIGTFLNDNYFSFKVDYTDFEGDQVAFSITSGALPTSLTIDPDTGWIYGVLDSITTTSEEFTFAVIVTKVADPTFISDPVTFTMTVTSNLANTLVINTPTQMSIDNGEISQLSIEAVTGAASDFIVDAASNNITADQELPTADNDPTVNWPLEYRAGDDDLTVDGDTITADNGRTRAAVPITLVYSLASGNLPVGLALTSTGLIVGRPAYTQFLLDNGETIFDDGETVFDGTATFTVRIVDATLGVIDSIIEFEIVVNPVSRGYENLYLVSGPTIAERAIYNTLINDTEIFPADDLYRDGDEYFGIAQDLRFLLADGLTPSSRAQYASLLERNHYTREFSFSELKIAKAEDATGTALYELIYADIVDALENNGESISQSIVADGIDTTDLATRGIALYDATVDDTEMTADDDTLTADITVDPNTTILIYPASLENMRNVIVNGYSVSVDSIDITADQEFPTVDRTTNGIGQSNLDTLPDWMTTIQDDGRALGFIPAVPIAYCRPGEASQIMFNINDSGFDLNTISFDVDRYVWDNNLTDVDINYYLTLGDTEASFDGIAPNGSFVGGDGFGGTAFEVGNDITLSNGSIITVNAIDSFGDVSEFTISSIAPNVDTTTITADNDIFLADMTSDILSNSTLLQADTTGTGVDFSLTPIRPADSPDVGDELLKFPKTNILQ